MSISSNLEFNNLLIKAAQQSVSDLHLSVGSVIKARVDGRLVDWEEGPVTQNFLDNNILNLLNESQQQELEQQGSIIFSHSFTNDLRFRIQLMRQTGKFSAVLRFIPPNIKSLSELGLPKMLERVCEVNRGLVIISGPSGAGKTTTIAAMVEHINQTKNKSIVTLEEPIEFIFANRHSLIEQREIPFDAPSFNQVIKDLLISDVEVVAVNHLPEAEGAANLLELAEKSLVILEMLSQNMVDTLEDFISVFDVLGEGVKLGKRLVLAHNLVAIFNQILVAKKGGGRVPVVEILHNDTSVATAIADNRLIRIPEIIVSSGYSGMVSKERSLAELVKADQVSLDEALKHVDDKEEFKQMILK